MKRKGQPRLIKAAAHVKQASIPADLIGTAMPLSGAGPHDNQLDILIAPFWHRDAHRQYFSTKTDFHVEDTGIELPPVTSRHGTATGGKARTIGRSLKRWQDERGVWLRIALDRTQPDYDRHIKAAHAGTLYCSSGVIPAYNDFDESTGEIMDWAIAEAALVIADPSKNQKPASWYAIARPRIKELLTEYGGKVGKKLIKEMSFPTRVEIIGALNELVDQLELEMSDDDDFVSVARNVRGLNAAASAAAAREEVLDDSGDEIDDALIKDAADGPNAKCAACGGTCGDKKEKHMAKTARNAAPATITAEEQIEGAEVDETKPEIKTAPAQDPRVAELEREMALMRAERDSATDAQWMSAQVQAGKVTDTEIVAITNALSKARRADALVKTDDAKDSATAAVKAMVEARQPVQIKSAPIDQRQQLFVAGTDTNAAAQKEVDDAYLQKMRSFTSAFGSAGATQVTDKK